MHHSCEVAGIQYFAPPNLPAYLGHFNMAHNNNIPSFNLSRLLQIIPADNSSSWDEAAEEQQRSVADERRKRRMISNRESARRSRMRKQKQLDELWSQVVYLRTTNTRLIDELNCVLGKHTQILHENARMREEAQSLREKLKHLQIEEHACVLPDPLPLPDDLEQPCSSAHHEN